MLKEHCGCWFCKGRRNAAYFAAPSPVALWGGRPILNLSTEDWGLPNAGSFSSTEVRSFSTGLQWSGSVVCNYQRSHTALWKPIGQDSSPPLTCVMGDLFPSSCQWKNQSKQETSTKPWASIILPSSLTAMTSRKTTHGMNISQPYI